MPNKVAYLFPAFTLKYTGKELNILNKYGVDFYGRLTTVSEILHVDLSEFDIKTNSYLDNEYKNQLLSYVFSSLYSEILNQQAYKPDYISGFSMGIYSAFYHAKVFDFSTGLILIQEVYDTIKSILVGKSYQMASVIGFKLEELIKHLRGYYTLEIVIQNGDYSFVIAGESNEVKHILDLLEQEGAIHLSLFKVNFPYHSKLLKMHKKQFESIVSKFEFNDSEIPIVSMLSQELILTKEQLTNELVQNIIEPLNFYKTIQYFLEKGVTTFIEVGADASLLKSSKFIEGDYEFKAVAKGKVL